ncbi:hypothetical protein B0H14DRAFT_3875265 [Mycena olivaceomarginata]|nr:hypothetical protein B0H14DRAFT_3875265 [Mycena olivaceomarginata]
MDKPSPLRGCEHDATFEAARQLIWPDTPWSSEITEPARLTQIIYTYTKPDQQWLTINGDGDVPMNEPYGVFLVLLPVSTPLPAADPSAYVPQHLSSPGPTPRPRPRRHARLPLPALRIRHVLPNTLVHIARPCAPAHVSVATPVPSRLDAASTPARLPPSRARPVPPYAAAVASLHALPVPSRPHAGRLSVRPALSPPLDAAPSHQLRSSISIHTIHGRRYRCGRYWANRRYPSLRPPPSHDHGRHSLRSRGSGLWARWIDDPRVVWQRVALPMHSGFPSPRAASSLNDRSDVSTPPVPAAAKSKDNREVNEWGTRARVPHVPFCPEVHVHNAGFRTELENLELEPDADQQHRGGGTRVPLRPWRPSLPWRPPPQQLHDTAVSVKRAWSGSAPASASADSFYAPSPNPTAMYVYLPLPPRFPGPLSRRASLSRAAPSLPTPPRCAQSSHLHHLCTAAHPAYLRSCACRPHCAPYRITSSTSGPLTHAPLYILTT